MSTFLKKWFFLGLFILTLGKAGGLEIGLSNHKKPKKKIFEAETESLQSQSENS